MAFGCRIYLGGGNGPDLVVVRSHENVGDTSTHHANDPLIEGLGLGVGDTVLQGSVNHAINGLDLLLLGEHGDVVLEGVGDPFALAADVGDTLVAVPVIVVGEGFVDTVIKVLVVGEDNVTTDIEKLYAISLCLPMTVTLEGSRTKPSGVTSVEAKPPGVSWLSTINHEGPFYISQYSTR